MSAVCFVRCKVMHAAFLAAGQLAVFSLSLSVMKASPAHTNPFCPPIPFPPAPAHHRHAGRLVLRNQDADLAVQPLVLSARVSDGQLVKALLPHHDSCFITKTPGRRRTQPKPLYHNQRPTPNTHRAGRGSAPCPPRSRSATAAPATAASQTAPSAARRR